MIGNVATSMLMAYNGRPQVNGLLFMVEKEQSEADMKRMQAKTNAKMKEVQKAQRKQAEEEMGNNDGNQVFAAVADENPQLSQFDGVTDSSVFNSLSGLNFSNMSRPRSLTAAPAPTLLNTVA